MSNYFVKFGKYIINRKKTCLVTGGNSGIGYSLAKLFAKDEHDLILVSEEDKSVLEESADKIRKDVNDKIEINTYSYDLTDNESPELLFNEINEDKLNVDILVNCAGFGRNVLFEDSDNLENVDMINLNVNAPMQLTKLFLPSMIEKEYGKILFVSSIAGCKPVCYYSVYSPSKQFINGFSQILQYELKKYDFISVTNLVPGSTYTNFSTRSGSSDAKRIGKMQPDDVARIGYKALFKGRKKVIAGWFNNILARVPDKVMLSLSNKAKKGSKDA